MRASPPALAALLLAGCGGPMTGPEAPAPETSAAATSRVEAVIYTGGVVHTLDPAHARAVGLRIEKGRITHLFDSDPPADLPGRRVELRGAAVLPGLVDAHLHLRS